MTEDQLSLFNLADYDRVFDIEPDDPNSKRCKICEIKKPLEEFPKHRAHADRLDTRCKSCIKKGAIIIRNLKKTSPPAPELCECCGKESHDSKSLRLDHCHDTQEFRGWLCDHCNTAIGRLGDDVEGLMMAVSYLKKAQIKRNLRNNE
jgi:hypothetical protein